MRVRPVYKQKGLGDKSRDENQSVFKTSATGTGHKGGKHGSMDCVKYVMQCKIYLHVNKISNCCVSSNKQVFFFTAVQQLSSELPKCSS